MFRFYWGLLRKVPRLLWRAEERLRTTFGVLTFLLLAVNQEALGRSAVTVWHGVSPWWSILPLALLIAHGLLRENFDTFEQQRSRLDQLPVDEAVDLVRRQLGQEIDALITHANQLVKEIFAGQSGGREQTLEAVERWAVNLRVILVHSYGIEFEWARIYAVPVELQELQTRVHSGAIAVLELLRDRTLDFLARCSKSSPTPLRPATSRPWSPSSSCA